MSLESGTYVQDLQQSNPPGTDKKKQGDDHLRLIKTVLKNTFPNTTRAQYFARGVAKTTTYSILDTDMSKIITGDATSASFAMTLPTLTSGDDGWVVAVVKIDATANTVTLSGTVNGATDFVLTKRWEWAYVQWTGTAWVAARFRPSVGTSDLEDNSITNAKMADNAVNTAELVDLGVTSGKLADNAVATAKIVDASVTNVKLAGPRMTIQRLTSGTAATYTTPADCHTIRVRAKAGGAAGFGTGSPGAGGDTTFNSVVAKGGLVGSSAAAGLGGSGGSGSADIRRTGSDGATGSFSGEGFAGGGNGGPGWNGNGAGGGAVSGSGSRAATAGGANTGAGGGGAAAGGGGGAGEEFELLIQSPAASYTYTIGAAGAVGSSGAAGGTGYIEVEEYY